MEQAGAVTTNPAASVAAQAEDLPGSLELRAFDERMHTPDGLIIDEEAEQVEDELRVRFLLSPEAAALRASDPKALCPRALLRILRLEQNVTVTRLEPADVVEALLEGLPAMETKVPPELAPSFVSILQAFFRFLDREFELPHAKECAEALDKGMALALAHMLRATEGPDAWEEDDVTVFDAEALRRAFERMRAETSLRAVPTLSRAERNKKKAQRRAQKAARRRNR